MVDTQQTTTQEKILTPCRNQCVVDWKLQYCTGCRRTLLEIERWRDFSNDHRRDIIKQTKHRDEIFFRDQCRFP